MPFFVSGVITLFLERLPSYVIFKGKTLYTCWTEGGPAGALFAVSDSGWMEKASFLEWFFEAISFCHSKPLPLSQVSFSLWTDTIPTCLLNC